MSSNNVLESLAYTCDAKDFYLANAELLTEKHAGILSSPQWADGKVCVTIRLLTPPPMFEDYLTISVKAGLFAYSQGEGYTLAKGVTTECLAVWTHEVHRLSRCQHYWLWAERTFSVSNLKQRYRKLSLPQNHDRRSRLEKEVIAILRKIG